MLIKYLTIMRRLLIFFYASFLVIFVPDGHTKTLILEQDKGVYELKKYGQIYFNYDNKNLDLNTLENQVSWQNAREVRQHPSINTYSKWFKFNLENNMSDVKWYLSFGYARLPLLKIFILKDGQLVKLYELDKDNAFNDRPLKTPQLYIPLPEEAKKYKTIYIEYQTFANAPASLKLHSHQHMVDTSQKSTMLNAASAGIVIAVLLIILVNLFFNPNKTNVFYALWTLTFLLIVIDMSGFTLKYFWPQVGAESSLFSILLMTTIPIFHVLFIKCFLQLKQYFVKLNLVYNVILFAYIVLVPISLYFGTVFFNLLLGSLVVPVSIFTIYWSWQQSAPGIKFFSLSLLNHIIFLNVLTIFGASFGNLVEGLSISTFIKAGYLIEVLLFTVALAIQNKALQNQLVSYLQNQVDSLSIHLSEEKSQRASNIKAVKLKEEKLFADLSHELRTPLTVMKVQVESLQHNIVDNVELSYGKLMNKINELNGFIDNLMSVTPSGQMYKNTNIKSQQIKDLILTIHDVDIESDNLSIKRPELLDYSTQDLEKVFDYDPQGFKIVLEECCHNAESHGGNKVNISVKTNEDAVLIYVDNSGEPLQESVFERIFDPLVRLDDARQNGSSHKGVGLSLCKKIIDSCNGQIFASNGALGGMCIHIVFPIKA